MARTEPGGINNKATLSRKDPEMLYGRLTYKYTTSDWVDLARDTSC